MRNRNILIGAALVSLAVGALVGSTLAASGAYGNETQSFTVPVARVGDEADYVVRWHERQAFDGTPVDRTGHYGVGIRVDGVETVHDATFLEHEALAVTWAKDWMSTTPSVTSQHNGALFVDLITRDFIQKDSGWDEDDPTGSSSLDPSAGSAHWYGPWAERPYDHHMYDDFPSSFLESNVSYAAQGRTFTLGDDLSQEALQGMFLENVADEYQVGGIYTVRPVDFEFQSRIEGHGHIGEYEVFGLVRELQLEYATISTLYEPGTERFWNETQTTTFWLSPEIPWPVRIERELVRQGDGPAVLDEGVISKNPIRNYTLVQDLVRYQAGEQPVAWNAWEPGHYREMDPDASRAPAGTMHVVGGDGRLPYSYDEAYDTVHSDPAMTGFHDWLDGHPDAVLAGVWFAPRAPEGWDGSAATLQPHYFVPERQPVATWSFVYAEPGPVGAPDQAYGVTTTRNLETGDVVNGDWGESSLTVRQEFAVDDLPSQPVTLAYLDEVWQRLAPAETSDPLPTSIGWGFSVGVNSYRCYAHGTDLDCHDPEGRLSESGAEIWGRADGALWVDSADSSASWEGTPPERVNHDQFDFLWLDAETGHIEFAFYWAARTPYTLGTPVDTLLASQPDTATAQASGAPVSVDPFVAATVAAASLLSIILFAYFLPLVRYAGAWAIGVIPGYAKVRKSELLDNETREQIVEHVKREPGISPPELHKRIDAAWSTIVYHLRVLEKNDLLTSTIDGRHKRIFPPGDVDRRDMHALAVLQNDRTRELFDMIEDDPGAHQAMLARRAGISHVAVRWHLRRLKGVGLIGGDKVGRKVAYFPLKSPVAGEAPEIA